MKIARLYMCVCMSGNTGPRVLNPDSAFRRILTTRPELIIDKSLYPHFLKLTETKERDILLLIIKLN